MTLDVLDFYDRHPINEEQVLAAVSRRRGALPERLAVEDLFDFDQDHYGGLAAIAALAQRAAISAGTRVLDVCAGLGGPARFLAARFGCHVVGIELNHQRAAGARRLSARVGLGRLVTMVRGDATRLPFASARFGACISQEGLLHIEDKAAVLAGCHRVLRPGGRLAFTDWITHPRLADRERERLREWMAAVSLQSIGGYRALLGRAGFVAIDAEDLSDEWRGILRDRLTMYRSLRADTIARLGETRYAEYDQLYAFFVGLVEAGKLGGARFAAVR